MQSTPFTLPTSVISNAPGVNGWLNPQNLFLVDNQYATSNGPSNITVIGNFNLNIPQGSDITNFVIQVKGYIGAFSTALTISAIDDTSGITYTYPAAPFSGFDGVNTLYTLPATLFGTTWTVDQANNIKLQLVANGPLQLDAVLISAQYVPVPAPVPVPPSSGQVVVDEFVEAQPFQLSESITATDLFMFLDSFTQADGVTPIQYSDFYGTEGCIVIDQGIPGKEEQCIIASVEQNYQSTGKCRIGFGTLANRGLRFVYPYDSVPANIVAHDGTARAVLSNDARFYSRFLKKNQIDALVSAPIDVEESGATIVPHVHKFNFTGSVTVTQDGLDPDQANIDIAGNTVTPPVVVGVGSGTSGNVQVPSLTFPLTVVGVNRGVRVSLSTEQIQTVSSITFNGVPLTQKVVETDVGTNQRTEQWFLVAPPLGTHNVVITLSAPAYISAGAEALVSVNQSTPTGATGTAKSTSLTPNVTLTTTVNNSLVFDSLGTAITPIVYTVGPGQILDWSFFANTDTRQGAGGYQPTGTEPDVVTSQYAITQNTEWVMTSLEVIGISPSAIAQVGIQFDDAAGAPLGSSGTVDEVELTGTAVTSAVRVGNKVIYTMNAGGGGTNQVAVDGADTTPDYLTNKISLGSSDASVTITPSIINPGGNEVQHFDLIASGSSGSGVYTVNADPAETTYFTNQLSPLQYYNVGGGAGNYNLPFYPLNVKGNGYTLNGLPAGYTGSAAISPLTGDALTGFLFNHTKKVQFKQKIAASLIDTSASRLAIGFGNVGNSNTNISNFTSEAYAGLSTIKFVLGQGNRVWACASNGASITATVIAGVTVANPNTYTIVLQPGSSNVLFYINGVLKATLTTNIPTTATPAFYVSALYDSTDTADLTFPVISYEL